MSTSYNCFTSLKKCLHSFLNCSRESKKWKLYLQRTAGPIKKHCITAPSNWCLKNLLIECAACLNFLFAHALPVELAELSIN